MSGDVAIIGMGMMTPLGLNAEQTAASVRAGLSAFEESAMMDKAVEPFVIASLPDDVLADLSSELAQEAALTYREARMLRLAQPAIEQALEPLGDVSQDVPVYLGFPEMETQIKFGAEKMLERLSKQCNDRFDLTKSKGYALGRAAGLIAVHAAFEALQSGSEKAVLVGGIDTYIDPYVLATLDMEKRVNSEQTMDGFTPGEGAAFLLMTTVDYARSQGYEIAGLIQGSATGEEPGHMYSEEPYKGEGLANTFKMLFVDTGDSPEKIPTVFSSMNGENHFAKEWGVSYIRNQDRIESEFRIEHPADCIGDTGAACGPIMIGLAMIGLQSEFLQGPVLVYASSDHASRAACIVSIER